jgi:hypothetical protein
LKKTEQMRKEKIGNVVVNCYAIIKGWNNIPKVYA